VVGWPLWPLPGYAYAWGTTALNALCPGQDKTKCNHYNTSEWQLQKRRLPLLRSSTVTSHSQLVGHIALTRKFVQYCSEKIQKKAKFRLAFFIFEIKPNTLKKPDFQNLASKKPNWQFWCIVHAVKHNVQ